MTITARNPPDLAHASLIAAINPGFGILYYEKGTFGYVHWENERVVVTELTTKN